MKHLLVVIIMAVLYLIVPNYAFCQTDDKLLENTASFMDTGSYEGVMDVEMGKDKRYDNRPVTYEIKHDKLLCDFPKIGKMPGKIMIDLPIQIDDNGNISAEPESLAGFMKMPMGLKFKLKLEILKDARLTNRRLSFVMTVYGQFMGKKYPTIISFRGKKRK